MIARGSTVNCIKLEHGIRRVCVPEVLNIEVLIAFDRRGGEGNGCRGKHMLRYKPMTMP